MSNIPTFETINITLSSTGTAELCFSRPERYNSLIPQAYAVSAKDIGSWLNELNVINCRIGWPLYAGLLKKIKSRSVFLLVVANTIPRVKSWRCLIPQRETKLRTWLPNVLLQSKHI
jgi:hypothetical protein